MIVYRSLFFVEYVDVHIHLASLFNNLLGYCTYTDIQYLVIQYVPEIHMVD